MLVDVDGSCPLTVKRAVMIHRWERLTFLHWSFEPAAVQGLLPTGLEVETFDGRAWVGLVPFHMWVAPPRMPAVPWLSTFCETNVRTYVRDRHGRSGVWFFSLEASRLPAVVAARTTYLLPYFWASMRLHETPSRIEYVTRRRWPGPRRAGGSVVVRPGERIPADQVTPLEHFLTARWRLFSHSRGGNLRYAEAEHPPWPLRRVHVDRCDDSLLSAAGLPAVLDEPLAHYSPGVQVRIGLPKNVTGKVTMNDLRSR